MANNVYVGKIVAGRGTGEYIIKTMLPGKYTISFPLGILGTNSGLRLMNSSLFASADARSAVASYGVLSSTNDISTSSAIGRAALGAAMVGSVGLLAGLTAKRKQEYKIQVTWGDYSTSVIELNEEGYNIFSSCMQVHSL